MSDKSINYRFIIPLEYLPLSKKSRGFIYNEILQEFQSANIRYAEVKLPNKSPVTICVCLRNIIKRNQIKTVQVRYIHKKVYLERVTPSQVVTLSAVESNITSSNSPKAGDRIELQISKVDREYGLFRISGQSRYFFPGYKVDFVLETDIGEITANVTSAAAGTPIGDPNAGKYVTGGLREWYRRHPEVAIGTKLAITCLEPYKRYKLNIVDSN